MKNAIIIVTQETANLEKLESLIKSYNYIITEDTSKEVNIAIIKKFSTTINFDIINKIKEAGFETIILFYQHSIFFNKLFNSLANQVKEYNIRYSIITEQLLEKERLLQIINSMIKMQNKTSEKKLLEGYTQPKIPLTEQASERKHKDDIHKSKHGRQVHYGSRFSMYTQPSPMIFSRDNHSMWFGDMYKGCCGFMILGGPSFANLDHNKLIQPGILTMGINNSVKTFRPNIWVSVDNPGNFMQSIWLDPKIMKFVPYSHTEKTIFNSEHWVETDIKVGECPNTWYYKRNECFNPSQFLFEDTFNWGNHSDLGGGRSVMLVAIRLMFYLGIRTVFLLGCDFKMDANTKYHFDQDRAEGSIKGNNNTYKQLIERFKLLKPIFDRYDYKIYNCNKDSELKTFPYKSYDEAVEMALIGMPNVKTEPTAGLYDRKANEKKEEKAKKK